MDGYVDANGVHTFYEIAGDGGDPIIFLHGGIVSGADYGAQRDGLSTRHTVILPDRRGHGRTPEIDAPFGYGLMADDTVAFMDAIGLERAHVVGHSDGAILALLMAIAHPDRVNRVVPISGNTRPQAMQAQLYEGLANSTVADFAASAEQFFTGPVRPSPSMAFFERMRTMFLTEPDITSDDLARISAPTLILGADRDFTTLEDLVLQFQSIPGAQLAIVPGTGHELTTEVPGIVNDIILRFLAAN